MTVTPPSSCPSSCRSLATCQLAAQLSRRACHACLFCGRSACWAPSLQGSGQSCPPAARQHRQQDLLLLCGGCHALANIPGAEHDLLSGHALHQLT